MKKKIILAAVYLFFLSTIGLAQQIKKPVVSGSFYPDSPKILAQRIKQFLSWVDQDFQGQEKQITALISPHAGYDYSGSVAAFGYKAIKDAPFRTVIIIGPSHHKYFDGISVYPEGAWQTPLGNVPIDNELAASLIQEHPSISFYEPAFAREHSLEVQLPFLQMVLNDFKIVPVACGKFSYQNCQILSEALLAITKQRNDVLVVASTDMSHYHPDAAARKMDNLTITELKKIDPESLYGGLVAKEYELCGAAPVVATLLYAQGKGGAEIEILKYATSGDVSADKGSVVGYLSAIIYAGREQMRSDREDILNEQQKKRLLEIARETIDKYVTSGETLAFTEEDPLLLRHMGAFVTIHKQGALRGCIGNIIGRQPLYLTVRDMAIASATADHRFPAVSTDELKDIDIEISVLTEPEVVTDVNEIEMGTHGVIVRKGLANGVFLPQVADETGWSREEFLANLCAHKAGLNPNAWQDKDTELRTFTAQVFGEK